MSKINFYRGDEMKLMDKREKNKEGKKILWKKKKSFNAETDDFPTLHATTVISNVSHIRVCD